MRVHALIAAIALGVLAVPALSHVEFAQYEGRDAVQEGQGGTKVVKNGIDFWTSGAPPRKYQVLGIITDSRKDKLLSGHAVGSDAIAKRTLEAGGSAVIFVDQNSAYAGSSAFVNAYSGGNYGSANAYTRAVHNITSRFVVIKYLDQ